MVKWEYYLFSVGSLGMDGYYYKDGTKIVEESIHYDSDPEVFNDRSTFFNHIQKLGNEGWELVTHTYYTRGRGRDTYIFKRPVVLNEFSIEDMGYKVQLMDFNKEIKNE